MKQSSKLITSFLFSASILLSAFSVTAKPPSGGKGAKDGGGGTFSEPMFWTIVRQEIIPGLKSSEKSALLTEEQRKILVANMDPMVTKIEIKKEQLYIRKDGIDVPVDAVNFSSPKRIQLFEPAWQLQVRSNMDIKHLILHEFMGVSKISDQSHISSQIFPPERLPISFSASELQCSSTVKYIRIKEQNWHIRDMPPIESIEATLSAVKQLNLKPKCADIDPETYKCRQYAQDFQVKSTQVQIPIKFDKGDSSGSTYHIDAVINLLNSYYSYGWGAAATTLFKRPSRFQIFWKLVRVGADGTKRTLSVMTSSTEETDSFSDRTTLGLDIPVSDFLDVINNNGFQLSIASYSGEITDLFHSYNVAGFLEDLAVQAGIPQGPQRNDYITHTVLKGMTGNALPFRINTECVLIPKEK